MTNEPKGGTKRAAGHALRFCVQHHLARADHYDLRLEYGGVARSWALPKGPSFNPSDKRLAVRVEDHPVEYMDFEGIIPKGEYGGGTVMLWDEGEWIPRVDPKKGLSEGSLKFTLRGTRLKGDWALVRMKSEDDSEPWLLIKERDGFEKRTAGISRFTRGIRSGKSMEEIGTGGRENPFRRADVMLADLCGELPAEKGLIYELKYDGHRTLGFVEHGKAVLKTRNGADCSKTYPLVADALAQVAGQRAAVVDGEMIVVGKDGIPDFSALQAYARRGSGDGLVYVLFDLLALDGEDLRERPLLERKEKLKTLLKGAPPLLSFGAHTARMTARSLEAIKKTGVEGIVIKRADSPYRAGKNGDWRKLKFRNSREFVIGGYTASEGGGLRSLLVGYYEGDELRFAGRVGSGFSESLRRELKEKLPPARRCPFSALPKPYAKNAVWTTPSYAAQVEYAEFTPSGLLRQASFKGLRTDKPMKQITDERAGASAQEERYGIPITHPQKTMYPAEGLTKGDLIAYYAAVAPRMFPHVKGRPLSLVCCPSGVGGERFFRRHLDGKFEGVGFFSGHGERENFFLKQERGIVALAQYNAVEFHVRGGKGDRCDVMVFDLDPDEGLPLADTVRGARLLRDVLSGLGLVSFLKTSGGKGYHLTVPLRAIGAEKFREFAKSVALLMENAYPTLFTANISKRAREGKIFLDWQRNTSGATSVAPYSLRVRDRATVSMPISWRELSRVAPDGVTLRDALKRLEKKDPWADYFTVKSTQVLKIKR